ncbi:MAG: class I SAM-dependent rRNA methyltransferase, partial [Gammaproteobacteria bacterium]|nr:class I SAM-dependent rRNA methyltransferase [Gammaproteobacteria bacterium]
GLIVDRYGGLLVVQVGTAGMEVLLDEVIAVLVELLAPEGILLRNDTPVRVMEQLPLYTRIAWGAVPDVVELCENGARFSVAAAGGQKTGWFYDHRLNRVRVASYARGQRVLDVFSYCGGFAIQAALHGATSVTLVDSSREALASAAAAAERNQLQSPVTCLQGDAFEHLKRLQEQGERYDLVILDPPAFARRRRDLKSALEAYTRINRLAMRLIETDGILATASCSSHVSERDLVDCVRRAAQSAGRRVQILERGHQGPDHPVHPAIVETDYLKMLICRILA